MKLIQDEDGFWKFLDAHDTPFWYAIFYTEEDALKVLEMFKITHDLLDRMSNVLESYMRDAGDNYEPTLEEYIVFKAANRGPAVESSSDGCTNRGRVVE